MTQQMDQAMLPQEPFVDLTNEDAAHRELEAQMVLLNEHYDEISRVGAISREQAERLVGECAVEFGEDYPTMSFTEIPSTTNLNVAVESIAETAKDVLVKMIKAAVATLRKIAAYVMDLLSRLFKMNKSVEEKKANMKVIREVTEKVAPMVPELIELTEEQEKEKEVIETQLKNIEEMYNNSWCQQLEDIFTNGPFTHALRTMVTLLPHSLDLYWIKIEIMDKVATHPYDRKHPGDVRRAIDALKPVIEPMDVKVYRDLINTLGVKDNSPTFSEMIKHFGDAFNALVHVKDAKLIPMDDLIDRFIREPELSRELINEHGGVYDRVRRGSEPLADFVQDRIYQDMSSQMGEAYRKAFATVSQEYQAMAYVVTLAASMQQRLFNLFSLADKVVELEYKLLLIHANAIQDPKEREKILTEHKEAMSHLQKHRA